MNKQEVPQGKAPNKTKVKKEARIRDWINNNAGILRELCNILDYAGREKNWEALGAELCFSVYQLKSFERNESPTDALINSWKDSKEATFGKFRDALEAIGQDTVVEVLEKYLEIE